MKNRDVYQRDPFEIALLNNGVATVTDALTGDERRTLRFELTHFVCEGQYRSGLVRILESCVRHQGRPEQPAAWISGFFGSGKSHLAKMLRFLWTDYAFPEGGARARGLARLPDDVLDLFTEVSTLGRQGHGLHAAAGTLGAGAGGSVRLALLGIAFKSAGLPESFPQARFCLWLRKNGIYEQVRDTVATARRESRPPALQRRPAPGGLTPSRRTDGNPCAASPLCTAIDGLVQECAYEHWHGMLFARFLAENHLLIEPEMGVAVTLDECEELAKEEGADKWALAARYAHRMLPQVFRPDLPVFEVRLAREHRLKLEGLVEGLPAGMFTATDSLGWVYQFRQSRKKAEVSRSEVKIGADELSAVTQLFTEPYMVGFLLDNTLGAWWAARRTIWPPCSWSAA